MHKTLEEFVQEVANDVEPISSEVPAEAQASGQIIEMLMQLIMSLLGNCPTDNAVIAEEVKSPSRRSKVLVRVITRDIAQNSFLGRFRPKTWRISEVLITRGQALEQSEILSVIEDARNPNFLVV